MLDIVISVVAALAVLVFIAWLIMQPQSKVLKIAVPLFIVSFAFVYCLYLIACFQPSNPLSGIVGAFKAFVESYQSIAGDVDYESLAESPLLTPVAGAVWFEALFWLFHMLVFAMLAVSAFAVFGRKGMDAARLRLARFFGKKDIYHLFGTGEGSLQLGRNIVKENPKALVVYYGEDYGEDLRENIADFGGALIEVTPEARRKYLARARKENPVNVADFSGIHGEVVNGDKIADLVARKCVRDHAPYEALGVFGSFPERAYEAMVIGFGNLGLSCTKWLIENAQLNLNGKKPFIKIVGRDEIAFQRFMIDNPGISNCADIDFLQADVYSWAFRDVLVARIHEGGPLPKIFICTSPVDAKSSSELAMFCEYDRNVMRHIEGILKREGADAQGGIVAPCLENEDFWTPEIILHQKLDWLAMAMNGEYALPGDADMDKEEREKAYREIWSDTSEFHRDSSRAACDFLPAILALAGIDPQAADAAELLEAKLADNPELLEKLAQVEHNRWAAFHFTHGYLPMRFAEFIRRTNAFVAGNEEGASPQKIVGKPQQNTEAKEHVCLVSWEKLPVLDKIYARFDAKIADGTTSLQGRDKDNIVFLSHILGKGAAKS